MSKQMKMSAIMRMAWQFVKHEGMTLGEAMKCAWRNFKLKAAMYAGRAVRFTFKKVDGTIREALGTLAQAAINYIPNGNGRPAPESVQRYWDLEAAGYRSFRKASLLSVAIA